MAAKWVSLSTYLESAYAEGEAPDPRTIRRAIDRGDIAGKRNGRGPKARYFVKVDNETGLEIAGIRPVNDIAAQIMGKAAAR